VVLNPGNDVFVGRETELIRIAEVVTRVQQGQPWLVSIEGESGIGKSALAVRVISPTVGWTVLEARGDPSESDLPYGLVRQLLRGVEHNIRGYSSLLAGDLSRLSPFAVGAELLGVLGKVQAEGPVTLIIDDVQWADGRSVQALSFTLRRLSVDPVLVVMVVRGDREQLDEPGRRMLLSVPQRLHLQLSGLRLDDLAPLAEAMGATTLDPDSARYLFDRTEGHTLYVRTVLSDPESLARLRSERNLPTSLAAAIGDQLAVMPPETRSLLEMLAVVNARLPLAILGDAAGIASPSAAIEPAVTAGVVDWWPHEPTCPVVIRHALQRDAVYAALNPARRRQLHARAIALVEEGEAWRHRVASLDRPDEGLARQLDRLAGKEAGAGDWALAATHLQWASDISPDRANRERRLLTAALHLMTFGEARVVGLLGAVEAAAPSPLRSCALGMVAFSAGQLAEAELRFSEALAEADTKPGDRLLAAMIAIRLAGSYTLVGEGAKVKELARRALETGCLGPAGECLSRTLVAIGVSQVDGPVAGLSELAYLDIDPVRIGPIHVDELSFRGVFHLLAGDLSRAVADLSAAIRLVRRGASITLALRAYGFLALAQYLAGSWDDAQLTCEQGLSVVGTHAHRFELPLLHLAATCVPAGRGAMAEAEHHAALAEEAAEVLDYGQENVYAGMARALVCQPVGDYRGVAGSLNRRLDDGSLDGRTRMYEVIWGPLLIEGLIGAGSYDRADVALRELATRAGSVRFLRPALAWLKGWLAEGQGHLDMAHQLYQDGEEAVGTDSPLYRARLLLAYGRLLRRTGHRRLAIERLRQANDLFRSFGAAPFIAQTEGELAACGLTLGPVKRRSALDLTGRESEVAHLINQRLTNAEIAAELFITPKAVEYHLGNIYAKLGIKGRQQLRHFLEEARQPALA
jgi:DNA-binding CsgD family transcriptional regulator